ncbi:MAG: 3-deoxy-D-manno-octulosonate 8-phosphate phosphatase (KDO 8-P phosphatase) [Dinoroseobacter sp.]|jgi:3-deoxy-D-manno-octulosonate 8-phosphate phosphatase (KDO 8-P phosphatase)
MKTLGKFSDLPKLPFDIPNEVMAAASKIRLALFDVDGVLTDGTLLYGEVGEQTKAFNALDGHGLKILQQSGIKVGVISARKSLALQTRLSDLNITHSFLGVNDKRAVFEKLISSLRLKPQQCAFTGDDVIDLPVMMECGLKFSVENGHFIVRHFADWVAPFSGGHGAVRAICDVLLYSQKTYPINLQIDSTSQ